MEQPLVSVVILSWNRCGELRQSLSKLRELSYENLEIIVVDNASTDGTVDMVKNSYHNVVLIENATNVGIPGYNIGFRKSNGEYIVVLDDDSYIAKGSFDHMVDAFQTIPHLGVLGFKIINEKSGSVQGQDVWNFIKKYGKKLTGHIHEAPYFIGCGAAFRRSIVLELGGYPPEFFAYTNEHEFSLRVLNAGYNIGWTDDITVNHMVSPTNRISSMAIDHGLRNHVHMFVKYLPLPIALYFTLKEIIVFGRLAVKNKMFKTWIQACRKAIYAMPKILTQGRAPIKWSTALLLLNRGFIGKSEYKFIRMFIGGNI